MIWAVVILLLVLTLFGAGVAVWMEASGKLMREHPEVTPIRIVSEAEGLAETEAFLREEFHRKPKALLAEGATRLDLLHAKREMFDREGTARDHRATYQSGDANGVPGEWTLTEGCDPTRRLLYLHGGGFTVGSPQSHRAITSALSRGADCAVFAPDYRLMPEHARLDSLTDSLTAYRWLLDNSPGGEAPLSALFIGGDSAGANLTLAVLQQARDAGLRAADAAVVFSPSADYTASGPNIRRNFATDTMLQPLIKPLLDAPRAILPFALWKAMGARPTDPRISPLFGDLNDLPPTLIQVSATEMLYDDAVRYAAKAQAEGSEVKLEIWAAPDGSPPLPHVWQMFTHWLPGARKALDRASAFLGGQVQ